MSILNDVPSGVWTALVSVPLAALLGYGLGQRNAGRAEKGKQLTVQRHKVHEVIHRYRAAFLQETRAVTIDKTGSFDPKWVKPGWREKFASEVFREAALLSERDKDAVFKAMRNLVGPIEAGIANDYAFLPDDKRTSMDRANWMKAEALQGTRSLHIPLIPKSILGKINRMRGTAGMFTNDGLIANVRAARVTSGTNFRSSTEHQMKLALAEFDRILGYLA